MTAWTLLLAILACTPSPPEAGGNGRSAKQGQGARPAKAAKKAGKRQGTKARGQKQRIIRGSGYPEPSTRPALTTLDDLDANQPGLVLLVIMDTLRSDRTHVCGHDKPNTPVLDAMTKNLGYSISCAATTPASWTLPSHASFFTGAPTSEHGVHTHGTALGDDFETLAELYAERGYQTAFLSANPVFSKAAGGFWQGFDTVVGAKGLSNPLRDDTFNDHIGRLLDRQSNRKPLFLVVNIFDAHDPYPAVPGGLDWATPADELDLHPHTADADNPYFRFVTGAMPEDEQGPYLDTVRNAYDHAVFVADRNLGKLMKQLEKRNLMAKGARVLITSDHGEHLGEHGLLRHGSHTWETVTRVPLLYKDSTATTPITLPERMSATTVFDLIRDGALPKEPRLVEAATAHNKEDFKPSANAVSLWPSAWTKLTWEDGTYRVLDLTTDPGELNPSPMPSDHPLRATLDARIKEHEASILEALGRGADPDVMEMLQEVGYVQ